MKLKKLFAFPAVFLLNTAVAYAHCPLCTIGAAAAAGGAAYLGVNNAAIGVLLGGFAVSIGWWIGNKIKKKFFPYQKAAIILISFITTIIPLLPFLKYLRPLYIPFLGQYGTTLVVDYFLVSSVIGGIIVCITPYLSSKATQLRNGKQIPFQGILMTFILLFMVSALLQFVL